MKIHGVLPSSPVDTCVPSRRISKDCFGFVGVCFVLFFFCENCLPYVNYVGSVPLKILKNQWA